MEHTVTVFSAWNCNANGLELLTLCSEFDLCLTNNFFHLPFYFIDYIIVCKKRFESHLGNKKYCGVWSAGQTIDLFDRRCVCK